MAPVAGIDRVGCQCGLLRRRIEDFRFWKAERLRLRSAAKFVAVETGNGVIGSSCLRFVHALACNKSCRSCPHSSAQTVRRRAEKSEIRYGFYMTRDLSIRHRAEDEVIIAALMLSIDEKRDTLSLAHFLFHKFASN